MRSTKGSGKMDRDTVEGSLNSSQGTFIWETGNSGRERERDATPGLMETNSQAPGLKIA